MTTNEILLWTAMPILLWLAVPFTATRKLLLELSALVVRVSIMALLVCGAVLWFRPDLLPAACARVANATPVIRDVLPSPEAPTFGLAAAALISVALLPFLAMLDVTRKLAGARLRRLHSISNPMPAVVTTPAAAVVVPPPAPRRSDRRVAADVMARAGSRNLRG